MRYFSMLVITAVIVGMASAAVADLQNVEVNGSLRIRGNVFEMDNNAADNSWVEQRTRLGVKADFTDDVSAVIELDSYDIWGEDFRSAAYITGIDTRANSVDDVEMYQAYIQVSEMWGTPLSMKVGRQEIALGNQFLFGVNDASAGFTGLSWDGVVLSYQTDVVTVCGLWGKITETMGNFSQDDVDMYGIYGSYMGFEDVQIDAYVIYVEDDIPTLGDGTDLWTVGLRGAGAIGAVDFEAEVAYQFGDVEDAITGWWWTEDLDYDNWGINLEVGYTLETAWSPRIYAGFAWLEGDDDYDELSFNRLFTNIEYSEFIDDNTLQLSNVFVYRLGISAQPSESVSLLLAGTYFDTDAEVDNGGWLWWDDDDDSDLGWELGLYADYQYSEDLVFRAGWAHFFASDGMDDGNAVLLNGLLPIVDDDNADYDYLFLETEISF